MTKKQYSKSGKAKRNEKRYTIGTGCLENIDLIKDVAGVASDTAVIEWAVAELACKLLPLEGEKAERFARSAALQLQTAGNGS